MNKLYKFIILIVVVKVIVFVWELSLGQLNLVHGFWGFIGGDWLSYLDPIDNWLSNGNYSPDDRMPGYGIALLLPRFFTDKAGSLNIVIVFQMIMSIASTVALAESARLSFNKKVPFFFTAVLYTLCISVSIYDVYISSESLALSCSVFSLYFLLKYTQNNKKYLLVFSGFFVAWAIFIRPVLVVLWLAEAIYCIALYARESKPKALTVVFAFALPFVVIDSVWVARNFAIHNEFRPLTSKQLYIADKTQQSENIVPFMYEFLRAWGGDIISWNPTAEIRWFGFKEKQVNNLHLTDNTNDNTLAPPAYIYTSKFNRDSMLSLKAMIIQILSPDSPAAVKATYSAIVSDRLISYTQSIKEEKPLVYYVYAPLKITRKLLFKSGTSTMFSRSFSNLRWFEKVIKIFESGLNLTIMITGFLGIFVALIRREFMKIFVPATFVIFYLVFVCFIFRSPEERFLVPLYPFWLLCSAYLLSLTKVAQAAEVRA